MSRVRFHATEISAERAQYLIDQGRLSHQVQLTTGDSPQGPVTQVEAQIPLGTGRSRVSSFFRLETGYRSMTLAGRSSWPVIFVGWERCGRNSCEAAQSEVDEDLASAATRDGLLRSLPAGVTVSEVRYGDVNRDRRTDILVRLSNGAALLYQQRGGGRAMAPAM